MEVLLRVHWLRHGQAVSHRGDMPLTEEGWRQAEAAGQRFGSLLSDGEVVYILHAPTRRTRETAMMLHDAMQRVLDDTEQQQVGLLPPAEQQAIRNPDLYVAGKRVELVSSAEALAEQIPPPAPAPAVLAQIPFWRGFWEAADRIGFWVNHPDPPGEDAATVARRLMTFATSLLDLPCARPRRFICVTHSPLLRAFLRHSLLKYDPGEPAYGEAVDLAFVGDGTLTIRYREQEQVRQIPGKRRA